MEKIRAGVIGATGMVGQRFLTLLENPPAQMLKTGLLLLEMPKTYFV